jgi:hypothetical protein
MRRQPQQPALPPSSLGLPSAGLPPAVGIPSAGMPPADIPAGGPPSANWPPVRSYANEPTDQLPLVPTSVPARPAGAEPPRSLLDKRPPPPRVAGRAVLVYEPEVKKPWRLWVFTAVLVSLTVGVVLGQAEAYQPTTNRSSAGTVGAVPPPLQPTGVVPTGPVAGPPPALISAPLGQVKTRQLEVTGNAAMLRFRTADLGDVLFNISGLDASTNPTVTDTKGGTTLAIAPTGAPGTVGAEVVLSTKVAWTVKLTAGTTELDLDSRAGGIAALDIAGGAARSVLQLPKPKGTVPLTVAGTMGELTVRTEAGAPVRVRLGKGAATATVGGRTTTAVKAGSTLTEDGWRSAKTRYDVRTTGDVTTLIVDRLVNAR